MYYFLALLFVLIPSQGYCLSLAADTVWSGEVMLSEDVLVPEGVTLSILPGTVIRVSPSESTKTDPEYLSPLTEITVRGRLRAAGTPSSRISFSPDAGAAPHSWAGIIVDGGSAELRSCAIQGGDTAIQIFSGSVLIQECIIEKNRYGVVSASADSATSIRKSRIRDNDYGLLLLRGAKATTPGSRISNNRKRDVLVADLKKVLFSEPETAQTEAGAARIYGDQALTGETLWQGRITVSGILRIPADARLVILPGTVIEFTRRDTNNDGIGENGLLVQGVVIAKGDPQRPIVFRSAEKKKLMGDWDAVNIMNSDGARNIIEHCLIEDAYRGLHFHFANVGVRKTTFRNNYRGIQFQESAVEIKECLFSGNKSGLQARDSELLLLNNRFMRNYTGANILRSAVTIQGNTFGASLREGLRIREGEPVVEQNLVHGNRFGILVADAVRGRISRNAVTENIESGIAVKGADNLEISSNFLQANGISGLVLQDARATVIGNHVSNNGERGVGLISFGGSLSGNTFVRNTYALDVEGAENVSAPDNWWGTAPDEMIHDGADESGRGRVEYDPPRSEPALFEWPLPEIAANATWAGSIRIPAQINVRQGATLTIAPGARLSFTNGSGISVAGKIVAAGRSNERILFTAAEKNEASAWGEILLDHATDSRFAFCDFEYATWGIHSHFTNLVVEESRFSGNYGGLRFRSGPVTVRRSVFEGNYFGIRVFRGTAVIAENRIVQNETGLFIREKGGGLRIRNNDIAGNRTYGIRVGDFNDEDVDARENWWGGGEPTESIFDGLREPGIGRVLYEPYRKESLWKQ